MRGDPIDPISFERAERELWERLAANAGLPLKEHLLRSAPDQPADSEIEDQLERVREEAQQTVWGLCVVGELRAWRAHGDNWKRLSPHAVRDRVMQKANDEPWGFYVDREELASLSARFPNLLGTPATGSPRRRGRPPRSGYNDEPQLLEMRRLLMAGEASSVQKAAEKVAEQASGASFDSTVSRLRKKYTARWGTGA